MFNYKHGEVSIFEGTYGLIRKDMSRKPVFAAYYTLTTLIGKHQKITYTRNGNVCRADWISPDSSPVCAFWTFDGKTENARITLGGGKYRISGINGKTAKKGTVEGERAVEKRIGIVPFYIMGAKVISVESAAPEK